MRDRPKMDLPWESTFVVGRREVLFPKGYKLICTYVRRNFWGPIIFTVLSKPTQGTIPNPPETLCWQTGKTQKEG